MSDLRESNIPEAQQPGPLSARPGSGTPAVAGLESSEAARTPSVSSAPEAFRTHWYPRPGWHQEARYLAVHLLLDGQTRLLEAVRRDQQALSQIAVLEPVPLPWLHLTVQGVGHVSDIGDRLGALVEALRAALSLVPPITMQLTPRAQVHREGVLYEGWPAEPIRELRSAVRWAVAETVGPDAVPGADSDAVWPHFSIAYARGSAPTAAASAALAAVGAGDLPWVVQFGTASLIELRTEGRSYRWDTAAAFALRG